MVRLAVLLALLAALVPAAALAAGQFPDPPQMTPAQSTNIPSTTTSLTFTVNLGSRCVGQPLQVVVANQSTTGSDGVLVASARVDSFPVADTGAGVYQGATSGTWLQTPGTYFWQGVANAAKCDGTTEGGDPNAYATPVVAIVVGSPTSSSGDTTPVDVQDSSEILTIAQAKGSLPDVLRKGTRRTPRRVSGRCSRHGSGSLLVVFCTTRWTDGKTWTYNGSVRQALNDDGTISARFDGRRARLSCIKHTARKIDEKRCYKKFHFTAEV